MFYFTCNESKIYDVSLFEITYKKKWTFHDILIYWDAPVYNQQWNVSPVRSMDSANIIEYNTKKYT